MDSNELTHLTESLSVQEQKQHKNYKHNNAEKKRERERKESSVNISVLPYISNAKDIKTDNRRHSLMT